MAYTCGITWSIIYVKISLSVFRNIRLNLYSNKINEWNNIRLYKVKYLYIIFEWLCIIFYLVT